MNEPIQEMMRRIRHDFCRLANSGQIGRLIPMPAETLLNTRLYQPRRDFLEVADQPEHVFAAAFRQTQYYKAHAGRCGAEIAVQRMTSFRKLLNDIRDNPLDDAAHAPVVILRGGRFVNRLDGTHRICVRRFLGQGEVSVVAIDESAYAEYAGQIIQPTKVAREIQKYAEWYQAIEIAPGLWTKPERKIKEGALIDAMPDLAGKAVLDLGCNNGLYSFEAAMHGANKVLGIDKRPETIEQAELIRAIWSVTHPPSGIVQFKHLNIFDHHCPKVVDGFDVLIAACVIYHLGEGLHRFMRAVADSKIEMLILQGNNHRERKFRGRSAPLDLARSEGVTKTTQASCIFELQSLTQLAELYGFVAEHTRPGPFPVGIFVRAKE